MFENIVKIFFKNIFSKYSWNKNDVKKYERAQHYIRDMRCVMHEKKCIKVIIKKLNFSNICMINVINYQYYNVIFYNWISNLYVCAIFLFK